MKSKLVTVLVVILLVITLIFGSIVGFLYYRNTHVFVEGKAYPIRATELNLLEDEISISHYDALHALLPDCTVIWNVPFQDILVPSNSDTVSVTRLTREDIAILKTYLPALTRVDAAGCSDYAMLEELAAQLPNVKIDYSVSLGGKSVAPDSTSLELKNGEYQLDTLLANIPHLPKLDALHLIKPELSLDEIDTIREAFPELSLTWTVEILGQEHDGETTELNLSALTAEQVPEVCEKLPALSKLETVELMDADGKSNLSKADVKALMEAAPDAVFHYTFDFYGQTLSTDTEEVRIAQKRIGDAGEAEVRLALDLMPNCKRFVMEYCYLSNDVLAKIRDDYRDRTKVVWRVNFGAGSALTDSEVIRCVYDLVDDNSHDLIYCEDVRYMDIGHDDYLDSIDFVAGMPNLEVIIISGSPVKDLSPLANCKKLRILEAADCGYVKDIAPLAECESLEMLNICYTKVTDLSPLDELNITHLQARGRYRLLIPQEEQDRFMELHPDCWAGFATSDQPYGRGWRYDENDKKLEWYSDIAYAFRYPNSPNNTGWPYEKS